MPTEKRLLDSYNGINQYVHLDPMRPNDLIIQSEQDCSVIADHAKQMRERPVGKEWRLAATVPMIFIEKAHNEGWANDAKKWAEFLNNPDYKAFRVWGGRVGHKKQI